MSREFQRPAALQAGCQTIPRGHPLQKEGL